MVLSSSEMDFVKISDSNRAFYTDSQFQGEAITLVPEHHAMWKKTDVFNPDIVPELVQQVMSANTISGRSLTTFPAS